jgi:WD40 repeat protein
MDEPTKEDGASTDATLAHELDLAASKDDRAFAAPDFGATVATDAGATSDGVCTRAETGVKPGIALDRRTEELAPNDDAARGVTQAVEAPIRGATSSVGVRSIANPPESSITAHIDHTPRSTAGIPTIPGYEIHHELGRGGMGVVYKARQIQLDRPCALKMILAGAHANSQSVARFLAEAQAIARLQHPHIVQIFSIGEMGGLPYVELEYQPGGSLDRVLDGSPWQPATAARLVEQLARGIAEAHRQGIVHRDLKPANVLLSAEGVPKISDFGLAKFLGSDSGQTKSEAIMGSPSYMAPEQAEGKANVVSTPADIYALGAILYELLTGRPPFRGASILDTLEQVKTAEPVPPSRLVPRLSRDIETICLKCLQKEPGKRYVSANAVAEDLRRFQARETISARPVGGAERAWRWCRRNRTVATLLGTLIVALAAGTGISSYFAIAANRQIEVSERRLYLAEMNLARQAWTEGQIDAVEKYLAHQEPKQPGDRDHRSFDWYYLKRLCRLDLRTLTAHAGGAKCIVFSPDGQSLATGGGDNTVRIWRLASGEAIHEFKKHNRPVATVAYSPDGQLLASGGQDNVVWIWDTAAGKDIRALRGHTSEIHSVSFSPDGQTLASASADQKVIVWNISTGTPLRNLNGHGGSVNSVLYLADGKLIASAGADRLVRLWDAGTGQEVRTLRGHTGPVNCVVARPGGLEIATASDDRTIRLWEVSTGRELRSMNGHAGPIRSLGFSHDGMTIASAGDDNIVRLWNWAGEENLALRGHAGPVRALCFNTDGRTVISVSDDHSIKIWDTTSSYEAFMLRGINRPLNPVRLAYRPDGRVIVAAYLDGRVRVWDVETHLEIKTFRVPHRVYAAAFSSDGKILACRGPSFDISEGRTTMWDAVTGTELKDEQVAHVLPDQSDSSGNKLLSNDGRFFLDLRDTLALGKGVLSLRDSIDETEILTFRGIPGAVKAAAISPDDHSVALAISGGHVRIWDGAVLTEDLLLRREASSVVRFLFAKGLTTAEVLVQIGRDRTLGMSVRVLASKLAELYGSDLVMGEAEKLVDQLFKDLKARVEVIDAIRTNSALKEPVRKVAMDLAEEIPGTASNDLLQACWNVLLDPTGSPTAYARALRQAEEALGRAKKDVSYWCHLTAVGAAQYRAGSYREAVSTLTRADQRPFATVRQTYPYLDVNGKGFEQSSLAFLAMAQNKLGKRSKAIQTLDRLGRLMEIASQTVHTDYLTRVRALVREAQATALDSVIPADPFAH